MLIPSLIIDRGPHLHYVSFPHGQGTCLAEGHVAGAAANLVRVHHLKLTDVPDLQFPVHPRRRQITKRQSPHIQHLHTGTMFQVIGKETYMEIAD